MKTLFVLFMVCLMMCNVSAGQKSFKPNWKSLDARSTPEWFLDAKFGIFIHWGVYSVPAFAPKDVSVYARYAEWYWNRQMSPDMEGHESFKTFHDRVYGPDVQYQDFATQFKAEMFDPNAWADLFKRAGAKYVVLTSKHHDGFCLWPSPHSWNWNAVDAGPHRDLVGDLSNSVKAAGIQMGYYFSMYEWFNPLYHSSLSEYIETHMWPQLKDLVTRYEPAVVWSDGEWDHPSAAWKSPEFLAWLYNESSVRDFVAVNDRWGKETRGIHGGYYTTEYSLVHDKEVSDEGIQHPWEECRGIGHSFGYNRAETLEDYSTAKDLIHLLADLVSKGGNLLLDIGPTADGRIPVIMEERLLQIGAWLDLNGEAIYGTRRWRVQKENDSVVYTSKGSDVYAICLEWPGSVLTLQHPKPSSESKILLLGVQDPLEWKKTETGIEIQIPDALLREMTVNHAWVVKLSNIQ